jgi:flagellar biosynthetic protein FlhB
MTPETTLNRPPAAVGKREKRRISQAAAEVLAYIYQLKQYQQHGGEEPELNQNLPVPKELDPEAES